MKYVLPIALGALLLLSSLSVAEELSRCDQIRAAVQGICPVSGQKLGSMGQPIKVKIGQEELFLCCKGCMSGQVKTEHWSKIHANFAKAQAICPVMKKPLPANPKWTIANGRIVYVCCPGCNTKIQAVPAEYLKVVDQQYAAYVSSQPR